MRLKFSHTFHISVLIFGVLRLTIKFISVIVLKIYIYV